jgi:SMI1 / KNR4 family (SUKH-1)
MDLLGQLEKEFNFRYPALYKQLYEDGMLEFGQPSSRWFSEVYPTLKQHPSFLLYAKEFELIFLPDLVGHLNDYLSDDGFKHINRALYRFIPFAANGAGDDYCFLYNADQPDDSQIVLVAHDDNYARILANHLQEFIFTEMLAAVQNIGEEDLITHEDFYKNSANFYKTHQVYLNAAQQRVIQSVYQRTLSQFTETLTYRNSRQVQEPQTGLLSEAELTQYILQASPATRRGQQFLYSLPEPVMLETEENKRRVGVLSFSMPETAANNPKVLEILKTLNWRQQKNPAQGKYEYYRSNSVLFGLPSMQTVEGTFRDKLRLLKALIPSLEIRYKDDATQQVHIF